MENPYAFSNTSVRHACTHHIHATEIMAKTRLDVVIDDTEPNESLDEVNRETATIDIMLTTTATPKPLIIVFASRVLK